jgi:hypothetical protein
VPENGTTPISRLLGVRVDELPPVPRPRVGVARTARALVRLARAHHRLVHLPTGGQVRAMAWLDGREPCSYLLDPKVNFVPELLDFGYERELGRKALNFTLGDHDGYVVREMVALGDGGMFDLLASAGW